MIILALETSCDETSAAVIKAEKDQEKVTILSNISPSSMALHAKTGGIIPEIAAREQIKYIMPVIKQALAQADIPFSPSHSQNSISQTYPAIDAIAVTVGPGLIGSLLVGVETAKTLAFAWNKPLIPVNHLFGHMYANWIQMPESENKNQEEITFPVLALIISGGHTDLVMIKRHEDITWLGGTRDDAAGEALDKIGRLLNLPYPGGPAIEQIAKTGNPKTYHFPRPLMYDKTFDFSFSGLKTAVLREFQKKQIHVNQIIPDKANKKAESLLSQQTIANIARCTQDAIIDVLLYKTLKAAETYDVSSIIISGGVSANQTLREEMQKQITKTLPHVKFFAPDKTLSTDNAAMIGAAAYFNQSKTDWHQITANPQLYFD